MSNCLVTMVGDIRGRGGHPLLTVSSFHLTSPQYTLSHLYLTCLSSFPTSPCHSIPFLHHFSIFLSTSHFPLLPHHLTSPHFSFPTLHFSVSPLPVLNSLLPLSISPHLPFVTPHSPCECVLSACRHHPSLVLANNRVHPSFPHS